MWRNKREILEVLPAPGPILISSNVANLVARFLGDSISNSFLSTVNRGLFAARGCPRNSCVSRESQNSTGGISAKTHPIHLIYVANNYAYLVTIVERPARSTTSRKTRETNIFFACLITVGRYCKPSSLLRREERSRRRIATSRRRMHSDERCHAHDVRIMEEEWKNGGPRWKGGGEDARDGDVQLISKRRDERGAPRCGSACKNN